MSLKPKLRYNGSLRLQSEEARKADETDLNVKVGGVHYHADGLTPPTRNIIRRKFDRARPQIGKHKKFEVSDKLTAASRMLVPSVTGVHRSVHLGSAVSLCAVGL